MTPKTLLRKNQKKAKRLKYRRCQCGYYYLVCQLIDGVPVQSCAGCGIKIERPWVGGGKGKRILRNDGERGKARAGSSPVQPNN